MSWIYLTCAILFEVAGTTAMKFAAGFTNTLPSVLVFLCYGVAFSLLMLALKTIELSVAYAIWSGAGTALIAAIGITLLGESAGALKLASIGLIIAGVVGLNLSGGH